MKTKIKILRISIGMTQRQLADLVYVAFYLIT